MISQRNFVVACVLALVLSTSVGCVQYPTEKQSVVDQRPQITFRFDPLDIRLVDARVLVDGLDSGRLGDFADGKGALRVLPGTHNIRVLLGAAVILEERAYIGDGVVRPFIVK